MANIGSIIFKKKPDPKKIEELLREINDDFFKKAFKITPPKGDENWILLESVDKEYEYVHFDFYFEKRRMCWYDRGDDVIWWCRETFANKIASQFAGAMMSDDGVGERWEPYFHTKYPTIMSWILRGRNPISNKILKTLFRKKDVPPGLRHLIGG